MRKIKIERGNDIFTIQKEKEHYVVMRNGKFHGTADTLTEAENDVENNIENEKE